MKKSTGITGIMLLLFLSISNIKAQWVETKSIYGGNVFAIATDGTNTFAGTDVGVFLSTNNGTSWTPVNSGLTTLLIKSIAINGSTIFVGTYMGGIFRSTNNGSSWDSGQFRFN